MLTSRTFVVIKPITITQIFTIIYIIVFSVTRLYSMVPMTYQPSTNLTNYQPPKNLQI